MKNIQEKILRTQMDICSKVMRSGFYDKLDPPLDLRLDCSDVIEDVLKLRQLQDLEHDMLTYGKFDAHEI